MPWKPRNFTAVRDTRLDPYWNRAAIVSNGDAYISTIFAEISTLVTQVSGHLWWTRWGEPREFIILHERTVDGFLNDHWILDDNLDEHLEVWEKNTTWDKGELRDLRWLDDAGSVAVRQDFDVEPANDRQ